MYEAIVCTRLRYTINKQTGRCICDIGSDEIMIGEKLETISVHAGKSGYDKLQQLHQEGTDNEKHNDPSDG